MNGKRLAVFLAAAAVGAVGAWPKVSHAWWVSFQGTDNLADSDLLPRYQINWAAVRYEDPFSVSTGSNVGVRGCRHLKTAMGDSCSWWVYAPATPTPATPSNAIQTLNLDWTGINVIKDGIDQGYFEYLRMGLSSSATSVGLKSTSYGN